MALATCTLSSEATQLYVRLTWFLREHWAWFYFPVERVGAFIHPFCGLSLELLEPSVLVILSLKRALVSQLHMKFTSAKVPPFWVALDEPWHLLSPCSITERWLRVLQRKSHIAYLIYVKHVQIHKCQATSGERHNPNEWENKSTSLSPSFHFLKWQCQPRFLYFPWDHPAAVELIPPCQLPVLQFYGKEINKDFCG